MHARFLAPFALLTLLPLGCSMASMSDLITYRSKGVNPRWIDQLVDPCDDFYAYACGEVLDHVWVTPWEAVAQPDPLVSRTFFVVDDIIDRAVKAPESSPTSKKLSAWYTACMNEPAIDALGVKPLAPLLDVIAPVTDDASLAAAVLALHKVAIKPFFEVSSGQDVEDPSVVIAGLDQGGLGMGERGYYVDQSPSAKALREHYRAHVERMFHLLGREGRAAKQAADDVLRIEAALADLAQDKVTRRDPHKLFHRLDRASLAKLAPHFAWDAYFAGLGLSDIHELTVSSMSYLAGADALMHREKQTRFAPI